MKKFIKFLTKFPIHVIFVIASYFFKGYLRMILLVIGGLLLFIQVIAFLICINKNYKI